MATNQLTPPAFTNTKAVREHLETWLGWVNEWHAADAKKRADAYNQRRIEEGQPRFAVADPNDRGSTWYRGRLVLDSGRKYLKISNEWTGRAFAFVRAADGAILRSDGGRPALNKIRGWIWVEDLTGWITEYGVKYLAKTGSNRFTMDDDAPQTWPAPGPQPEPTEEPEPTRPEDREVTIKLSELMKMESAMTALCAIVSLDHDGPLDNREQVYANSVGECKDTQRWLLEQAREAVKIPTSISREMRKRWALYSPEPAANVGRAVAVKRHEVAALRSSVNALLGVLAERSGTPTRASEEVFAGVYRTRSLEKGSEAAVGDFMAECSQVMDQTEGILD